MGEPRTTARGGAPVLSSERIVRAALDLVAREGLEALTMRRLAAELGTAPMSLYRHVRHKRELLERVVEAVAAQLPAVDAVAPWDETVTALLVAVRRLLVAHPGIAGLVGERMVLTPSALRTVEVMLAALRRGGLDDREAAWAFAALWNYTLGCVLVDQPPGVASPAAGLVEAERQRRVAQLGAAATAHPSVWRAVPHWMELDGDRAFEHGLRLLLSGLARRSAPPPPLSD